MRRSPVGTGFQPVLPADRLKTGPHKSPPLLCRRVRCGMTLFEVVVSLVIFLGAVAALSQLINIGTERSLDVQQQAQASMKCQSKLAEIVSGAESLDNAGSGSFPEDPNWTYTVEATPADIENLHHVRVTVTFERANGTIIEASLAQSVLDPGKRGSTLEAAQGGTMP